MSSVRQPVAASAVARLIAVVVLPTPPFWFATAILIMIILAFSARSDPPTDRRRPISGSPHRCGSRSEEHTSELQSLMRISYAVFCLKKKKQQPKKYTNSPSSYQLHR